MHWFIAMKRQEQAVLNYLERVGPRNTVQLFEQLHALQIPEATISEALHSLKMWGLVERSDAGEYSIKALVKTNGAAHAPPALELGDSPAAAAAIDEREEQPMVKKETKTCPRCKEDKPLVDADGKKNFYSNGYCIPCGRAKSRERTEAKTGKKPKARGGEFVVKSKPVSKRVAKYQHKAPADPLGRMVINLFSIRITDHAGIEHDLILDYTAAKQLATELKDNGV